jgi:acyl dehydratase
MNAAKEEELAVGRHFAAVPYLLDDAAAQAYERGLKHPPRRRARANIHTDRAAASRAGFAAPIAGGEQTIAVAIQLVVDTFGERFLRGGGFEVALVKPVLFGDTIAAHARIARADQDRLELEVWVENQHGVQVLTGTARVRAPEQ